MDYYTFIPDTLVSIDKLHSSLPEFLIKILMVGPEFREIELFSAVTNSRSVLRNVIISLEYFDFNSPNSGSAEFPIFSLVTSLSQEVGS